MTESALSRALKGWRYTVLRRARHRRLVHRCTTRMLHSLLSVAFDCWVMWTDRDSAQMRIQRLEEELQGLQLQMHVVRGHLTQEGKARNEAETRSSTLEQQLSAATIVAVNDAETLRQLRGKLQDTASELQVQRDKLMTAHAELEDALTFGGREQAKMQQLQQALENGE